MFILNVASWNVKRSLLSDTDSINGKYKLPFLCLTLLIVLPPTYLFAQFVLSTYNVLSGNKMNNNKLKPLLSFTYYWKCEQLQDGIEEGVCSHRGYPEWSRQEFMYAWPRLVDV